MINPKDFEQKLGLWFSKLEPFFKTKEVEEIYQHLKEESKKYTIVPKSTDTYRIFQEVNPNYLKTVWVLQDPYPRKFPDGKLQACGVAMDCRNGSIQPSLKQFYDAMSRELGYRVEYSPSLEYLSNQGVMLLNSDLTTRLNDPGAHTGMWEPFMKYLFQEVLSLHPGMIYVLAGKSSQRLKKFIDSQHNYIFELSHPASASYNNVDWDSQGIFLKINEILSENNRIKIHWDKRRYDEFINELPF